MTSLKNHKNFKKDCQDIENYINSVSGYEKEETERQYKKFLELVNKLDSSLFELTTNSLNYTLHQEVKHELSKVKKELDSKIYKHNQMEKQIRSRL